MAWEPHQQWKWWRWSACSRQLQGQRRTCGDFSCKVQMLLTEPWLEGWDAAEQPAAGVFPALLCFQCLSPLKWLLRLQPPAAPSSPQKPPAPAAAVVGLQRG